MNKEINKSNKIVRVLAVDDNESLIGMLEEYFKDHEKIKIVNHAYKDEDKLLGEAVDEKSTDNIYLNEDQVTILGKSAVMQTTPEERFEIMNQRIEMTENQQTSPDL